MEYKNIMSSNNMYDTVQILAEKCREKDLIITDLKVKLGEVLEVKRKIEDKPEVKKEIKKKK